MPWRLHPHLRRLKQLPRTGWVQRGVDHPETVAAHTTGVALLALLEARRRGLDEGRAVLLALVHDLPESLVGDRVPGELPPAEKRRRERAAIGQIDREADARGRLCQLWEEYEAGESPEAQLVRALDLADAILQGVAYGEEGRAPRPRLADLVGSCLARVGDPALRTGLQEQVQPFLASLLPEPPTRT
ncbi:MAG: HD domain-containing protein [Myxococcota bacterium]|jgi:putative hydrolase of HD superfamily|nr:HD domain-containing protein [Myxococcota bacterium]